jgi:hypothetical protein
MGSESVTVWVEDVDAHGDRCCRSIVSMRFLPPNPVSPTLACVGGFLLTGTVLAALLAIASAEGVPFVEAPIARVVGFIGNALLWLGIARAWGGPRDA